MTNKENIIKIGTFFSGIGRKSRKNKKEFYFPEPISCNKVFKDFLDKEVDEKYYLTTDEYEIVFTDNQMPNYIMVKQENYVLTEN